MRSNGKADTQNAVDRDAVRLAALRALLTTAATPSGETLDVTDRTVARLLMAGYGIDDICAALAMEPAAVHGIVIRLAR